MVRNCYRDNLSHHIAKTSQELLSTQIWQLNDNDLRAYWCCWRYKASHVTWKSGWIFRRDWLFLFFFFFTSQLGLTANSGCLLWKVFCIAWNDRYGRDFLWGTSHNHYVDIPPTNWFFLAITSGGYSDLSGTYYFSIFLDSTNCRAVRDFSVWNRYWSTNLYVLSSLMSVSMPMAPAS